MPTVSLDAINNGDAADATPVNNNFQAVQSALNNLDANNWATGKIFAPSKLTQEAATSGQAIVWNGTIWAPTSLNPTSMGAGGAATGEVLQWTGSAWDPVPLTGTMLGMVQYNPTTVVQASTTSTTGADIDAANLSLTVTVPSSGKLGVFQTAGAASGASFASTQWGIRESTTDISYVKTSGSTSVDPHRISVWFLVTGLSAGSHTYKWAFKTIGSGTAYCRYGQAASPATTDPGPATMALFGVA